MKKTLITTFLILTTFMLSLPVGAQNSISSKQGVAKRSPVIYNSLNAYSDGQGVWLEWNTQIETRNLGFYVYRIVNGERIQVNQGIISGAYLQARDEQITSGTYSFFDRFGDADSVYVIESLNLNEQRRDSRLIQTQSVSDLTPIAGASSEQLIRQAETVKPVITGSESILPEDLANEVRASSQQADPTAQFWVAAQPGVKLGIKSEGFYRVSRADLQTGGFDVNASSDRWQLYLNGVEQAINVGTGGSYIEFYGKGTDTLYSDTQNYFLVVGTQNGKRIGATLRRKIGSPTVGNSYLQTFFKKERSSYSYNIFNGDEENFFGTIVGSANVANVSLNLTGVDFANPTSSIDLSLDSISSLSHQISVKINGNDLGTITGNGPTTYTKHFDFPTSYLQEGANSLQLQSLVSSDVGLFNNVKVNYARRYQANQNQLSFYVSNYKQTSVENLPSANVRLFDITNPDAPLLVNGSTVEQSGGTYNLVIPSSRGRVMFAVEDSAIAQPASITTNVPSTLSSADNSGQLLIISYKDFMTQSETWANYRRSQGIPVKVVNVEDVYDEFNYGNLHADAIKSFLQYAKSNWQVPPSYVLLMGDATYDPKRYFGAYDFSNQVPTRLVDTVYSEAGSDDAMADFNDDGLAEIPIGRIPARDGATITLVLNKVMTFEQTSSQGLNRGAIFASDLPDGYDFEGVSSRLSQQLPADTPKILINRGDTNAHSRLITEMNAGRYSINYSGHGNVSIWATTSFFGNSDAAQLTNSNLSIYTMLTCLNGYFIQPSDSMAEILLKNPNGGAVSAWASTGLTTPDIQEIMATRYYQQLSAGNITRLGDLIRDAKTVINSGRDVRLSWALLGDPMLKVR